MKLLGFAIILAALAVTTITDAIPHKNPVKKSPSSKVSGANTLCIFCEIVMGELDVQISERSTEQDVVNALDGFCTLLEPNMQQECYYFVRQYARAFLGALQQGIKPSMACTALKFCKVPEPENPACYWCKYTMKKTQSLLVATSEEDVLGTVGKICTFFPPEVKTKCTYFIATYGKIGLDVLMKRTPEQSCQDFGHCTSSLKKDDQKLSGKGKVSWRKMLFQ